MAHDDPAPNDSVDQPVDVVIAMGRSGVLMVPSPTWPALFRPCEPYGGRVSSTPMAESSEERELWAAGGAPSTTDCCQSEPHSCGSLPWRVSSTSRRRKPRWGSASGWWSHHQSGRTGLPPTHAGALQTETAARLVNRAPPLAESSPSKRADDRIEWRKRAALLMTLPPRCRPLQPPPVGCVEWPSRRQAAQHHFHPASRFQHRSASPATTVSHRNGL